MHYILENAYTKKLFKQFNINGTQIQLLSMSEVATLEPGHILIIDEEDLSAFNAMSVRFDELIILTKKNLQDLNPEENVRYIKKFQSIRNISTLITRTVFPLTFLVFASKRSENDSIIEDVKRKFEIDTIISFNFSPNSNFSLFDVIARENYKTYHHTILDVITNIQDYLSPPIAELITLTNRLKEKHRLLVVSAPLKGALDLAFMEIADTIILIENDKTIKLEPYLRHSIKFKRFEVIEYD